MGTEGSIAEGLVSPIEGGFPHLGTTNGNVSGEELDGGMEGLPVPRGWRGSIVGEIGDDGVYKENKEVESVDYMNGNGNANGNGNVHWTDEGQGDDVWVGVDESVGGEEAWLKMEEGIL